MKEGLAIHRLDPGEGGAVPSLRVMEVNPNCLALLQLDRQAVLGRDSFTLFGPDFAEHRSEFQRVEEREGFAAFELTLPGQNRLYAVQVFSPARGQIATLFEDITDRRESENERLNLERQLLQAQKLESLGILSGGIAHDFNNLLAAMQGYLNLVQMKVEPGSLAFNYLESMERVVHRATDLTSQMLAYSGKGRFVVKQHSMNKVIEDMNDLVKVIIPKKTLLDLDLAPLLPPVEADAAQIQQVILNLLTNASDAIGDQEGIIRITTRSLHLGPLDLVQDFEGQNLEAGVFVALEVSDTGCGMSPEVQARIFDPFFTTKSLGRGLGLSAIQGILRGHNAGLRIDSEPGRGTTFKVYFRASALAMEETSRAAVSARRSLDGTVLLVDDEVMITDSVSAMLDGMGLKVLVAHDGRQAVEVFQRERAGIDLVLMDLTMPHIDGLEAARLIHRLEPRMPVILSSGYSEHESIERGIGEQAVGFLQKPYSPQALYEVLRGSLNLSSI
jgi:signal transduction histidine kinase/CheY-like chemotaxis protein